jgi:hypothetical protein
MKYYISKGDCIMGVFTDMVISGLLKKGILYEAKNVDMEIDVPKSKLGVSGGDKDDKVKIKIKCDNMTLRLEKE